MSLVQPECRSLGGKTVGHDWGVTLLTKGHGDSLAVTQLVASQLNDMLVLG